MEVTVVSYLIEIIFMTVLAIFIIIAYTIALLRKQRQIEILENRLKQAYPEQNLKTPEQEK